jgi:hypothetical protein
MFWILLSLICLLYSPVAVASPAQIVILRHAEKPDTGDTLSKQGFERAAALVPFFLQMPTAAIFEEPVAIYVPYSSTNYPSTRSLQTVSALANLWAVPLYARFTVADLKSLRDEILNTKSYEGKLVVICWEHDHIPKLANLLGITNPPGWSGTVFDRIWVIDYSNGSVSSFQNLPQKLMYGDSDL